MKKRLCKGVLRLDNGEFINANLIVNYNNVRFMRTHGKLYIPINFTNYPDHSDNKWRIGDFMCTLDKHDKSHIYAIQVFSDGIIDKLSKEKAETVRFDVIIVALKQENRINFFDK